MNLVLRVLPLGVGAAFSPTVLAVVLLLLTAKDRSRQLASAFAAGALIPLAALTVFMLTVARATVHHADFPRAVGAGFDLGLGLVLLLYALHSVVEKPRERTSHPHDIKVAGAFGLGVVMMATNFSSLVLLMPALKDIAGSREIFGDRAAALALLLVLVMLPILLPLAFAWCAPDRSTKVFSSLRVQVQAHQRTIGIVIAAAFGLYLTVKGVRGM